MCFLLSLVMLFEGKKKSFGIQNKWLLSLKQNSSDIFFFHFGYLKWELPKNRVDAERMGWTSIESLMFSFLCNLNMNNFSTVFFFRLEIVIWNVFNMLLPAFFHIYINDVFGKRRRPEEIFFFLLLFFWMKRERLLAALMKSKAMGWTLQFIWIFEHILMRKTILW